MIRLDELEIELRPASPFEDNPRSLGRRYAEITAFVAVWMAIGFGMRFIGMSELGRLHAYLLLGLTLTILFQRNFTLLPMKYAWTRHFALPSRRRVIWTAILGFSFAVAPVALWIDLVFKQNPPPFVSVWFLFTLAGAFAAGYTFSFTPSWRIRRGLPTCLIAIAFGLAVMAANALLQNRAIVPPVASLSSLAVSFMVYLPICFTIEEVTFRGVLDPHLHDEDYSDGRGWLSAAYVSFLWGVWHLPITADPGSLAGWGATTLYLAGVHMLIGIPLSFCWRKSGSLMLPAIAHSLIDAYRDVILG